MLLWGGTWKRDKDCDLGLAKLNIRRWLWKACLDSSTIISSLEIPRYTGQYASIDSSKTSSHTLACGLSWNPCPLEWS